jgi:two-component system, OmpR family, alkaline phosphatase synthesis response regulator PhoP
MGRAEESPAGTTRRLTRRVLLVEDEPSLVRTLTDRMVSEGYQVDPAGDGETALSLLAEGPFDLVVLDVMLPGMDGFEVCRELRRRGLEMPVLMLTARGDVVDRVVGLKLGADDYLVKPFAMAELMARVEALLRRSGGPSTSSSSSYVFGDLRVDFASAAVAKGGRPVSLSSLELRLLRYLVEHRGVVVSREQLLDEVWGYESTPYTRTVDVHVASLRQKLETNPSQPELIVTVHRMGYKFVG